MDEATKLTMLASMTGEADETVLSTYLSLAAQAVLDRYDPFGSTEEVPAKYGSVQVEIAAYMLNKRGAEGEVTHSENGVSRTYEDGDIPPTLLRRIIPLAGVIG